MFLSFVSHFTKLIKPKEGWSTAIWPEVQVTIWTVNDLLNWRGSWEPSIYGPSARSTGKLGLCLAFEVCMWVGQPYRTERLTCRIWYFLWVDGFRTELNFQAPAGVQELFVGVDPLWWETGSQNTSLEDYPGIFGKDQCYHKCPPRGREGVRERRGMTTETEVRVEEGHEPQKENSLWKRRKQISPKTFRRKIGLPTCWFYPIKSKYDLLNCKLIKLCSFNPLSFW